jgi:hypothetical protein
VPWEPGSASRSTPRGHACRARHNTILGTALAQFYRLLTGLSPWPFVIVGEIGGFGFGVAVLRPSRLRGVIAAGRLPGEFIRRLRADGGSPAVPHARQRR